MIIYVDWSKMSDTLFCFYFRVMSQVRVLWWKTCMLVRGFHLLPLLWLNSNASYWSTLTLWILTECWILFLRTIESICIRIPTSRSRRRALTPYSEQLLERLQYTPIVRPYFFLVWSNLDSTFFTSRTFNLRMSACLWFVNNSWSRKFGFSLEYRRQFGDQWNGGYNSLITLYIYKKKKESHYHHLQFILMD